MVQIVSTENSTSSNFSERGQTTVRIAEVMFGQQPDWVTFFREVLGVDGIVRKLFPTPEEMAEFEKSEEYSRIQEMIEKLRTDAKANRAAYEEPTRVITVRLPKSLHEALRVEAHDRRMSLNNLCVLKLIQMLDGEAVAAVDGLLCRPGKPR